VEGFCEHGNDLLASIKLAGMLLSGYTTGVPQEVFKSMKLDFSRQSANRWR
jgi:hypothetical protein